MYTGTWQENTYIVTGSSGSGKSEVCKILSSLGAKVVSADELAREALAPNSRALQQVRAVFGEKVFENGSLNRKALAGLVFKDSTLREKLEQITHPIIGELAENSFKKLSETGREILLYDCPLFFETKLREKKFKGVILVTAPTEVKVSRIVARDKITIDEALTRLANQLPDEEKIPLVNFIIKNEGTLLDLETSTKLVFNQL